MNTLRTTVDNDKFARLVGIRLLDVTKSHAKAELDISEHHLNGLGMVHGGAIFALADLVFAAAVNSHGIDAVAITIHVSYFKAVRKGKLMAEAKEISLNRKLATYDIRVMDDHGDQVAAFIGTAYRRTPKSK